MQVSSALVRSLVAYVTAQAPLGERFLAEAGLTSEQLEGGPWFDLSALSRMVRIAGELCGDPGLALHWGSSIPPHALPVLGSLLLHAPTLRVAVGDLARYAGLAVSGAAFVLRETGTSAVLSLELERQTPADLTVCCELAFAWAATLARALTGKGAAPRELRLPYSAPAHAHEYDAVFRCPVRFHAPLAELSFEASLLALRQPYFHEEGYRTLREGAEALLMRADSAPVHLRVRALLRQNEPFLADGGLELLTASLHTSHRRLRRTLCREGTSFAALRDEVRKERALYFLGETELTIKDITERLGYSEASPFYRAFKRWTGGMTPVHYRNCNLKPRATISLAC